MLKKAFVFIVIIISLSTAVFAYDRPNYLDYGSDYRIDTSSGVVNGKSAEYTFTMPKVWVDYVMADRFDMPSGSKIIEKVSFYCTSINKIYKPALLLTINVYDRASWDSDFAYDMVIKTPKYVYALERGAEYPFSYFVDAAVFTKCYQKIDTAQKVKDCFSFPSGEGEISQNAVIVKNKVLSKTAKKVDKIYYLPLRDVCETLGYKVGWIEKENAFTIRKGTFYDVQKLFGDKTEKGYPYLLIEGSTYISSAYFYSMLGLSVEIDGNGNVFIL